MTQVAVNTPDSDGAGDTNSTSASTAALVANLAAIVQQVLANGDAALPRRVRAQLATLLVDGA